jgi:hypothetical protein
MRWRLRTLLALVALVAVALGAEATRRRWADYRDRAATHAGAATALRARAAQCRREAARELAMSARFGAVGDRRRVQAALARQAAESWLRRASASLAEADDHARRARDLRRRW